MIRKTYASFGREMPTDLTGARLVLIWVLSLLFVATGLAITVVLNFFSLFAGTLIVFLGRPGLEIRFLKIFGRIPAIAVAVPVLFAYAAWHQSREAGFISVIWPFASVWLIGLACILVVAAIRSRLQNSGAS